MTDQLSYLTSEIGRVAQALGMTITAAESCTGGGVCAALTQVAGSSAWFEGGVVSYANRIKETLLGVSAEDLSTYGAVSSEVVQAMALGVKQLMNADVAVAISGVAGPGGGSKDKPVGTVWLAWADNGGVVSQCHLLEGGRELVRNQAVLLALSGVREKLLNMQSTG